MEGYTVPQREVEVSVHLTDGRDLEGTMYAPATGPDGGPGHLIDRLNEESHEFFALTDGTATHLVHSSRLLTVRVEGDTVEEQVEQEIEQSRNSRHLLVKLHMSSGIEIIGHVTYLSQPEQGRLQDYLNTAKRFIPVVVKNVLTYVNREQIISARALRGES